MLIKWDDFKLTPLIIQPITPAKSNLHYRAPIRHKIVNCNFSLSSPFPSIPTLPSLPIRSTTSTCVLWKPHQRANLSSEQGVRPWHGSLVTQSHFQDNCSSSVSTEVFVSWGPRGPEHCVQSNKCPIYLYSTTKGKDTAYYGFYQMCIGHMYMCRIHENNSWWNGVYSMYFNASCLIPSKLMMHAGRCV